MEDQNKIYIVVAVLAIILIGIGLYMFSLDQKISKIEKEIKKN
jgi:CcmD family protein